MSLNPLPPIKRGFLAVVGWVHAAFCALMDPEGRRAWAVLIAFGAGIVETCISTYALWLLRNHPWQVFWLACEANGLTLIVLSALTGLLVKQNIGGSFSRTGVSFTLQQREDGSLHIAPAPPAATPDPPAAPPIIRPPGT